MNDPTDDQIRALLNEAGAADDPEQCALCRLALGVTCHDLEDFPRAAQHLADAYATHTRSEARAECARVLEEAAAFRNEHENNPGESQC